MHEKFACFHWCFAVLVTLLQKRLFRFLYISIWMLFTMNACVSEHVVLHADQYCACVPCAWTTFQMKSERREKE